MKPKNSKYLLWFGKELHVEQGAFPGWTLVPCPEAEDLWDDRAQFKGADVVIVQMTDAERPMVITAARVLTETAEKVRIMRLSLGSLLNVEALTQARPLPNAFIEMSEDDLATLADIAQVRELHPAQDYHEGVLHYGAKIKGKDFLVTSNGEMIPLLECPGRDILLIYSHLNESGMSQGAVLDYIAGADYGPPEHVHRRIVEYLKQHIYFQNEEHFDMLAVWVMGTYLYRAFRYYPYLHFNAEKGSGKTLLMELLAPIAFNGALMAQPPASTVLKLIEQNAATLFLDEVEGLGEAKSGGSQLKSVLKTGFARSGLYYNGDVAYRTYSPKCFAGINLLDDVLADRTIVVRLLRKTGYDTLKQYRETPLARKEQAAIRDELYHFGLRYGPGIAQDYDSETTLYDKLKHLTNRAYDIWVPLFKIVNSFSEGTYKMKVFQSMDHLSQTDAKRRASRDTEENETGNALEMIDVVMDRVKPEETHKGIAYYDPDVVLDVLRREGLIKRTMERKALSRMLKKVLDIDCKGKQNGLKVKRMYAIELEAMKEMKRRYAPEPPASDVV
ncbi:MAG: hypothetical protein F9K22_11010 [Bacteroidetes bacterium]|nr:MAG: hypothetical protein F9K22_11010 [Bacteroidota bacterium]